MMLYFSVEFLRSSGNFLRQVADKKVPNRPHGIPLGRLRLGKDIFHQADGEKRRLPGARRNLLSIRAESVPKPRELRES